jgi:Mor family transcriptional regulator
MGHLLPHLSNRWGSLHFTLEEAVSTLLKRLYGNVLITVPKSRRTQPKTDRNAEIQRLYGEGHSVPDLAKQFKISAARVYQVLAAVPGK